MLTKAIWPVDRPHFCDRAFILSALAKNCKPRENMRPAFHCEPISLFILSGIRASLSLPYYFSIFGTQTNNRRWQRRKKEEKTRAVRGSLTRAGPVRPFERRTKCEAFYKKGCEKRLDLAKEPNCFRRLILLLLPAKTVSHVLFLTGCLEA